MPSLNGAVELRPKVVDEKVPRWYPCSALAGDTGKVCGATPTNKWWKACQFGHRREIWLCGTHGAMCFMNAGLCRECADRGGVSFVGISRAVTDE
jgi:hypothetical protein